MVATVFADDNKKDVSTDLLRDEPVKSHYLSTEVALKEFRIRKRVCNVCGDANDCAQRLNVGESQIPPLPRSYLRGQPR